jgi:alpha-tubulin suppressor-like RCC1 family protein
VQEESVNIQDVVCGPTDTAIVLSDGRCFVSGVNRHGQLGLGHKNAVPTPTLLPDFQVQKISLGSKSSALLDAKGEFYTFGFGGSIMDGMGQLGHGNSESVLTPKLVESLVEDGCCVQSFGVGETNTVVLTTEGEVLSTGAASHGRLGNFETNDQLWFDAVEIMGSYVEQIAVGKDFTLAIRNGVVSGWGRNHKGQVCS